MSSTTADPSVEPAVLRADRAPSPIGHVLVVGGTFAEWAALGDARWRERVSTLGRLCDEHGIPWLTIRAYEPGPEPPSAPLEPWRHDVGGCGVIVDPSGDGRRRFAEAMSRLDPADEVNEATVAAVLYDPADCEPDLVVVLGPPTQLPPSLVWELAYAELVFVDAGWSDLTVHHLALAVADFSNRRRRFGGLDEGD